jgi:hypothetical protein
VLADVYKSVCLYEEQALVRTYMYRTGVVHLKSSTRAIRYASTGAVRYASTEVVKYLRVRAFVL